VLRAFLSMRFLDDIEVFLSIREFILELRCVGFIPFLYVFDFSKATLEFDHSEVFRFCEGFLSQVSLL
jgi:hypothetical protein